MMGKRGDSPAQAAAYVSRAARLLKPAPELQ